LFSELNTIHQTGQIRVVDLILVTKAADGSVMMREVSELSEDEAACTTTLRTISWIIDGG